MKSSWLSRHLFVGVLAFSLTTLPSCSNRESDGDILTEISNRMHADPSMKDIKAAVHHGVVTLTGTCSDDPCRQHATATISDIQGVKQVVNHITITPNQ